MNELRLLVNPGRLSATVSSWFQIIECPDLPAIIHEKIHDM
jgi:hypothetical protein